MMQSQQKREGSDELNCFIICRNMKEINFRVNSCKPSYPPSSLPLCPLHQDQASFNYWMKFSISKARHFQFLSIAFYFAYHFQFKFSPSACRSPGQRGRCDQRLDLRRQFCSWLEFFPSSHSGTFSYVLCCRYTVIWTKYFTTVPIG